MIKIKPKIALCILCTVVLLIIALGFALRNQIRTIFSVKKVRDGFYQMTYYSDYHLDRILDTDISTVYELEDWLSDNIFFGYPISGNEYYYGCSAFLAKSPDGDWLMGRNYDYDRTETLLFYTAPPDGYSSYAIADLNILGVGGGNDVSADDLFGRASMLASPYTITEGMNEKGLGAAILELETEEIHQDRGNTDMLLFVTLRIILDRAANVDEALSLLAGYDIHTFFGYPFHLFLADTSGRSVVVEWIGNDMNVIEASYATNFQLSEGENEGVGIGQDRYETIAKRFEETEGILTESEAMNLLSDAKILWNGEWDTEWSVVMNLSDFTLDVCIDMDYDNVYSFSKDDFVHM